MTRSTPPRCLLALFSLLSPAISRAAEITEAVVQQHLDKGIQFAQDGFSPQALKEFLWCYDEGMPAVPRLKSVRARIIAPQIQHLATEYDPAQQAMTKRCADAEKQLLAGDEAAAPEFAIWCNAMGEDSRLLKIFDKLPADDARRRAFGLPAFQAFLAKRRYADALTVVPFDTMSRRADATLTMMKNSPHASEDARDDAVHEILAYIEVLAGATQMAQAQEIGAKLAAFDGGSSMRRDIERRIKRGSDGAK